jgi:hypothetical protein
MSSNARFLCVAVFVATGCSGSTAGPDGSEEGGTGSGAPGDAAKLCHDVCSSLATALCPQGGTGKECLTQCLDEWRFCKAWTRFVACTGRFEGPLCSSTTECDSALAEVLACAGPLPDAGSIDCTPGQPVPPCICQEGGSPPVHLCDSTGKAPACVCP